MCAFVCVHVLSHSSLFYAHTGVFVALLLRFDRSLAPEGAKSYATPYFNATYGGYVAGLLTTIGVMHFFKAAQPALLYLVPACLLTSFGTAIARGQVATLLAYSEEENQDEDDKKSD